MCLGKDSRLRVSPSETRPRGPKARAGARRPPRVDSDPWGRPTSHLFASAGVKPMIWTPAPRATSIAWITS